MPNLALDIDTPRDLATLMARGGGGATIDACTRLRTSERPASAREALALLERAGTARTPRPRSHPSTTRGAEPCR